jgi:hypothetical protein
MNAGDIPERNPVDYVLHGNNPAYTFFIVPTTEEKKVAI